MSEKRKTVKATKRIITPGRIICLTVVAVVLAVLIVADMLCSAYNQVITTMLCGSGIDFSDEKTQEVLNNSDEMVQKIAEEGVVLLKNENGALPLDNGNLKVNLFGWSAIDDAFLLTGGGSAKATINEAKRVPLSAGLQSEGFTVNEQLLDDYTSYRSTRWEKYLDLPEPARSFYDKTYTSGKSRLQYAKEFSDTAIVVLSRYGSEGLDLPFTQTKWVNGGYVTDETRTYLQTTSEEDALLEMVGENFSTVIVLVNSANTMELGFLDDDKIDAALNISYLGQSGTKGLARILKGTVNPSGKTVDTFPYSSKDDPAFANALMTTSGTVGSHIHYTEGIYIGYKWYETADKEGYFESKGTSYDRTVQYPFGYGLSYSSFEKKITGYTVSTGSNGLLRATEVNVTVQVKNVSERAGKDVIELYYSAPYTEGGIEKSHVNLLAYEKTAELAAGEAAEYTLTFTSYDLASYDCYDANRNGVTGYELEAGDYYIYLLEDAHGWKDLLSTQENTVVLRAESTIGYKRDPASGAIIKNRFGSFDQTGNYISASAYADVPIDGSTAGAKVNYMSRADFAGTFPSSATPVRDVVSVLNKAISFVNYDAYEGVEKPTQGVAGDLSLTLTEDGKKPSKSQLESGSGIVYNEELVMKLGENYNDEQWESLLDQLTVDEFLYFVESSGYGTDAAESVGKPALNEIDGGSGFNIGVNSPLGDKKSEWTGFGSEVLLAQSWNHDLAFNFGQILGNEGAATGVSAIYAPGVNLHRSAYNGRNYEYYSEDPVISGNMASDVIRGGKTKGLYMYLKHFCVSEMGPNPRRLNVWLTEQNLRENYLKPFEIAVKNGANAIMSAFNRLGATWTGGNYALLTNVLRGEWGFKGVVITDWCQGDADMPVEQGVHAGNDIWLNPKDRCNNGLDTGRASSLYCARRAAKNLLYTVCNSYYSAKTYDPSADIGVAKQGEVFRWWIPVLVMINVVTVGILTLSVVMTFRSKKKVVAKKKK